MILTRTILFAAAMLAAYQAVTAETKSVGIVLATQGTVTAKDIEGKTRDLTRRSDLFVGDVIDVGPDGKAQLRFSDASLLTLSQNSNFRIDDYKFQEKNGDTFLSKLAKGGLRALPGAVEKNSPGVTVNTAVAVMGVRGTLLSFVVTPDITALGFFQGAGWLQNSNAQIELGRDQRFDFATLGYEKKDKPKGQIEEPAALGLLEYDAPTKDASVLLKVSPGTLSLDTIALLSDAELDQLAQEINEEGPFFSDPILKLLDSQIELRSEGLDCH